jgi:hypothetical protein
MTYGLFASVHVVFVEIVPETFVGPELSAGAGASTTDSETARRIAMRLAVERTESGHGPRPR